MIGRVGGGAEFARNPGLIGEGGGRQRIEVGGIDAVSDRVGGREDDVGVAFAERPQGIDAGIEDDERFGRDLAVADLIKHADQFGVVLAEDM